MNKWPGEAGRKLHQFFCRRLFAPVAPAFRWHAPGQTSRLLFLPAVIARVCHSLGPRPRLFSVRFVGRNFLFFRDHLRPRRKLQLAAHHDRFSRLHAFLDDGQSIILLLARLTWRRSSVESFLTTKI